MKTTRKTTCAQNGPIDFVILWVDGTDPAWLEQKKAWSAPGTDDRPQRYRDWGTLPYWFRGVEAFAPWVRTIHFVTWGHLPPWLDTSHPQLHIVRHEDFMPADALPTYSSRALELNFHRIKGLSEQFVYFNDDFLLIHHTRPEDFFVKGLPRDMLALQPVVANPRNPSMSYVFLNNALALSRHFTKRERMRAMPGAFFHIGYPPLYFFYNLLEALFPQFTGLYTVHGPSPFLKRTFQEVWAAEQPFLDATTHHRFRGSEDVNQYLIREWQKLTGEFVPANLHRLFRYIDVTDLSDRNLDVIRKQKRKMICLNDSDFPFDFETNRSIWLQALDAILPQPSAFEKRL